MRKAVSYPNYIAKGKEKKHGYAGGVFYALAKYVVETGGGVVGAAYAEDFSIAHVLARNMGQLKQLTGVKYAESFISQNLKEKIREMLQAGQVVLFAGVPCQIDMIHRFLGRDYEGLYTIAIRCPGVISAQVWRDYIAEVQANGSVITQVDYPYRGEFGISQCKALIKFSHGTAYFRDEKEDKLLKLKKAGLVFKEECYGCAEKNDYKEPDIFLCAYYDKSIRNAVQEEGLTALTVNTEKGKALFDRVAPDGFFYEKTLINEEESRPVLYPVKPQKYGWFWKCYNQYGFSFASDMFHLQTDLGFQERKQLDFFRNCTLLSVVGLSIESVLDNWGLKQVILFGNGDLAQRLMEGLREKGLGDTRIDLRAQEGDMEERMAHSELPVLIVPSANTPNIIEKIYSMGVNRKKVLSMDLLIGCEYEYKVLKAAPHTKWIDQKSGIGEIYLITGAQFENKGAQSMLFTAVSELRRMHPECDIYYLPIDPVSNYPDSVLQKYRFHIMRKEGNLFGGFYDVVSQLKAIVDVGGYAFSSNWNCTYFIQIALLAKYLKIPMYYMPQSFGPFDFPVSLDEKVKSGFEWAQVIFAREKEGYTLLTQKYGLNNVRRAKDLVLQNKKINLDNIYLKRHREEDFCLPTSDNVAIVPNMRNYTFGNRDQILEIYKTLIEELLVYGKNVYIVCHSKDEQACEDIYRMFPESRHVFLYEKQLDCLEFSILAKEFQYIFASRYHAIVHAYKEGIPCIALGWAEKYQELLSLFGQEKYLFDVRERIEIESFLGTVKTMNELWKAESAKIRAVLPEIQTENCFEVIV